MAALLMLLTQVAWPCTLAPAEPLLIDEALSDQIGPDLPIVEVSVIRGKGPQQLPGGGAQATSCDDLGFVQLTFGPLDEELVGYDIAFDPALIEGLYPYDGPVLGPVVSFVWNDGATDDQEPFELPITITPIDEGGDAGEPTDIFIFDEGSTAAPLLGCSVVGHPATGGLLLLLLPIAMRRRRVW